MQFYLGTNIINICVVYVKCTILFHAALVAPIVIEMGCVGIYCLPHICYIL